MTAESVGGRVSPTHPSGIDLAVHSDSTPTNSSDEFDWEAEEEESPQIADLKKAKRVRRLWLLYSRLSRGVRLLLVGVLGTAIILSPYVVFRLRFRHSIVYRQVAAWSIWLAISYAAVSIPKRELVDIRSYPFINQAIMTGLIVGIIPRIIIWVMFVFWGKAPESVKVTTGLNLTNLRITAIILVVVY